ncbi:MAG: PilZ domain-containing protein [Candidatus Omnitrophica bacterium]|nr:PilZ domain-containing protein [Candidatus Omnitrophota bacterium]
MGDLIATQQQKGRREQRACLRVPLEGAALILVDGNPVKNVALQDISTLGLSFVCESGDGIPQVFDIQFLYHGKEITTKVEIRNRIALDQKVRFGCKFLALSAELKRLITRNICELVSLSGPFLLVTIASLVAFCDAFMRLVAVGAYVDALNIESNVALSFKGFIYICAVGIYAIFSSFAFVLSRKVLSEFDKTLFLASTYCLIPLMIFIAARDMVYLGQLLSDFSSLGLVAFLTYAAFAGFVGFAFVSSLASLRKLGGVLDILAPYRERLARVIIIVFFTSSCFMFNRALAADANLVVEGIVYDEKNPLVMIQGSLYRLHDSLCAGTITAIRPDSFTVRFVTAEKTFRIGDSPCKAYRESMSLEQAQEAAGYLARVAPLLKTPVLLYQRSAGVLSSSGCNNKQDDDALTSSLEECKQGIEGISCPQACQRYRDMAMKMNRLIEQGLVFLRAQDSKRSALFLARVTRLNQELLAESKKIQP